MNRLSEIKNNKTNVIDIKNLLENKPGSQIILNKILDGQKISLKKTKDHRKFFSCWGTRRERLLFTIIEDKGVDYIVLLDFLVNHKYERSQSLNDPLHYKNIINEAHIKIKNQVPSSEDHKDSKEPLEFVDIEYQNKQCIYWDESQLSIRNRFTLDSPNQLLVIGAAGTGKTSLGYSLLSEIAHEIDINKKVAYITENEKLLKTFSSSFTQEHPDIKNNIVFLTYTDYIKELGIEKPVRSFNDWWETAGSKMRNECNCILTALNHQDSSFNQETLSDVLRKEFKVLANDANDEDLDSILHTYLNLGRRFRRFDDTKIVDALVSLFKNFLIYLRQKQSFDLDYSKTNKPNPYLVTIIDETQDLSRLQISNIIKQLSTTSQHLIMFMDGHQAIWDANVSEDLIAQISKDIKILKLNENSYRVPPKIARAADFWINVKHQLCEGTLSSHQYTEFLSNHDMVNEGNLYLHDPISKNTLQIPDLSSQADSVVIVLEPKLTEIASELFKTNNVFLPYEIKGCEFNDVHIYNPLYTKNFSEISSTIQIKDCTKTNRGARNAISQYEGTILDLHAFFVAMTRARNNLSIYHAETCEYDKRISFHKIHNLYNHFVSYLKENKLLAPEVPAEILKPIHLEETVSTIEHAELIDKSEELVSPDDEVNIVELLAKKSLKDMRNLSKILKSLNNINIQTITTELLIQDAYISKNAKTKKNTKAKSKPIFLELLETNVGEEILKLITRYNIYSVINIFNNVDLKKDNQKLFELLYSKYEHKLLTELAIDLDVEDLLRKTLRRYFSKENFKEIIQLFDHDFFREIISYAVKQKKLKSVEVILNHSDIQFENNIFIDSSQIDYNFLKDPSVFSIFSKGNSLELLKLCVETNPKILKPDPKSTKPHLLYLAVHTDSIDLIKYLLAQKIDVNAVTQWNNSVPIIYILIRRNKELLSYFLDHTDIDVNFEWKGQTPLSYALDHGLDDMAALLLKHKNLDVNNLSYSNEELNLLGYLCSQGKPELLRILLERHETLKDVNININMASNNHRIQQSALFCSITNNKCTKELYEIMLTFPHFDVNLGQYESKITPLFAATAAGNKPIVELLLTNPKLKYTSNEISSIMLGGLISNDITSSELNIFINTRYKELSNEMLNINNYDLTDLFGLFSQVKIKLYPHEVAELTCKDMIETLKSYYKSTLNNQHSSLTTLANFIKNTNVAIENTASESLSNNKKI